VNRPDYQSALSSMKVINDFVKRQRALIQSYNSILKKNEKQFPLQVVENHRRRFPDARKSTIIII